MEDTQPTLANWRLPPFNREAFSKVREIIPTASINRTKGTAVENNESVNKKLTVKIRENEETVLDEFLRETTADAFHVSHEGKSIYTWHSDYCSSTTPHIIFSVSKSLTALLIGCVIDEGLLSEETLVSQIIPEAKGGAFEEASVRDLLDMSVSSNFIEDYEATSGIFLDYRQSTGWNPQDIDDTSHLKSFLLSLKKNTHKHGEKFEYHSTNTDMLGIIIEKCTGKKYAQYFFEKLMKPLAARDEAYVTLDRMGTSRAAGGICISANDIMSVCEMVRCYGKNSQGKQVFPANWIKDILNSDSDKKFSLDGHYDIFPEGLYRSKWYRPYTSRNILFGLGIHGQWIWIDFEKELSIVCLSSEPKPIIKNNIKQMSDVFNQITNQLV
ncbi:MAG: serine hydrolase [Pseudomonadota bacterium]|nr:serine hydrolase [Pseudomonadota bacterium]MEC8760185.1 serine hydrolase [Pseudomonadota bacterium]